ncbi:hypothetical protein HQ585_09630 [candidate division KSB1 bacterium]|nr:hypothetical protein [candidate division KSB1 bacterium]
MTKSIIIVLTLISLYLSVFGQGIFKDTHPCVSPDESYLIFDSDNRERINNCELFISFKKSDASWTNPINMEKYIKQAGATMVKVTLDGKLIFYHDNSGISWWVSSEIINDLKPEMHK